MTIECDHLQDGRYCRLAAQMSGLDRVPVNPETQCTVCVTEPVPRGPNRVTASIALGQARTEGRRDEVRPLVVHLLRKVKVKIELGQGAGTELFRLLHRIGFELTPDCPCLEHASEMNKKGTDWCDSHRNIIYGWLKTEALRRKIEWTRPRAFGARRIIGLAIRVARAKEKWRRVRSGAGDQPGPPG